MHLHSVSLGDCMCLGASLYRRTQRRTRRTHTEQHFGRRRQHRAIVQRVASRVHFDPQFRAAFGLRACRAFLAAPYQHQAACFIEPCIAATHQSLGVRVLHVAMTTGQGIHNLDVVFWRHVGPTRFLDSSVSEEAH